MGATAKPPLDRVAEREYEGNVVAANIAGEAHPANYEAVPRVAYTDPQAAAVGALEAPYSATTPLSEAPRPPPTHTPTPNPTDS
jgi:pyruvate/2-oxoglutarate dehydrogenase complex dihydrolipoamide dehydrogenase (E3) component